MLFRDYAIRRYAELEKYDNIPLENVILTSVENQRYSLYKIIKKYYPCGKFYFHRYENLFSCPCVSIWTVCPRMFASDKKIVLYLASLKMRDYD